MITLTGNDVAHSISALMRHSTDLVLSLGDGFMLCVRRTKTGTEYCVSLTADNRDSFTVIRSHMFEALEAIQPVYEYWRDL